jgi:hypothetical protein
MIQYRTIRCLWSLGCVLSLGLPMARGEDSVATPTRQTYRQAVAARMLQDYPNNRWASMISRLLESPNPPRDGKYVGAGRGEVGLVLPLALTGAYLAEKKDTERAWQFTHDALQTLRVCCRIAVDHYYADNEEAEGGNRGQISFVLADVAQACQILRAQGALQGQERDRVRQMLEIIADYRMRIMPQPGAGGMSNWINRAGLGVLRAANYLEQELKSDAAFAQARPDLPAKIAAIRRYAMLPLKCGMDRPYLFKLLPDGSYSPPFYFQGHGNATTERPAPADRQPQFGITENSSGYGADSVVHLLCMIAETPRDLVPELTPQRRQQLCNWMRDWQQTVMPIGTVPSYGDAHWDSSTGWLTAFELAAVLCKEDDAQAAAGFRGTAARIFCYCETVAKGRFDEDLCEAALAADDSIRPVDVTLASTIVRQQSPQGILQPGKIVLRGEAERAEDQPFAMFDTFYNSCHSHGAIGGLTAYGSAGSVFQHEAGYEAGDMYFHHLVLLRPGTEPFLPFAKVFKDPRETVIQKGNKGLANNARKLLSAEIHDARLFAHARMVTMATAQLAETRQDFQLTRDALLEKRSGALIICDAVTATADVREPVACSPVWHVQNVLAKSGQGFLCQDDCQIIHAPQSPKPLTMASPALPVWIGLSGPTGFAPQSLAWHFMAKNKRQDMPQAEHLYLAGATPFRRGEPLQLITVFVPMPMGTRELSTPPATLSIQGTRAVVMIGELTYRFGAVAQESEPVIEIVGTDGHGKPYEARLFKSAGKIRVEEKL